MRRRARPRARRRRARRSRRQAPRPTSRRKVAAATCRASAFWATSCTRKIVAPRSSARTLLAMVPGTRSVWPRTPAILPRKLLREVPTTTGRPMATISSRRRSSSRLCSTVLPKPMPGSSQTRSSRDALLDRERESLLEERLHLGHDVVVARVVLHGARLAEHVHETAVGAATRRPRPGGRGRTGRRRRRSRCVAPASSAARATADFVVSMESRAPPPASRFDHRHHSPELLLRRDRIRARAGGLAADVEDRRPLLHEPPAVLHRRLRVEEQPSVRERVGRDVHDTHDHRRLHGPEYRLRA